MMQIQSLEAGAFGKGLVLYASHAGWDGDAAQLSTKLECARRDALQGGRKRQQAQRGTAEKCVVA